MKPIFLIVTFLFSVVLSAQTIANFSIDNGGVSSENSIKILYTIGEVNIQEHSVGNIILSEGFINGNITSSTLGLEDEDLLGQKIIVYPNPVSDIINIKTTFKNNIKVGDVEFNADDSGNLDINFNWSKTTPYLGFGFGRAVPNKRLGFAFDFGTYLSGSPKITLDATGIIEQTKDQEALLNESFKSFKFIPYGSFRLSYSL